MAKRHYATAHLVDRVLPGEYKEEPCVFRPACAPGMLPMADYQPSSRRPIADVFRRTAHAAVRFCVRHGIHPDLVSYASMVAAAGAALCFWQAQALPALLVAGVLLCYGRLWCNMLDGMVALAASKASRSGEIVNEMPDRFSDVLIFVGVAHSGLCHLLGGYWVAIFVMV